MQDDDVRRTETQERPNISTEHQASGDGGRPRDTLDREPKRDPVSGATIPGNYNPETMTRVGDEEKSPPVERVHPGKDGAPLA
jgi:hypothetical protein